MTGQSHNTSTPATSPSLFPIAEWFNASTKGLCEDAKAQIWAEVSSHYADAIEMHSEEGISGEDAEQRALADLGSPKKARRAFRKVYLTEREAEAVVRFGPVRKSSLRSRILYCALCVVGFAAYASLIEHPDNGSWIDIFSYAATVLLITAAPPLLIIAHFTKRTGIKILAQHACPSSFLLSFTPRFVLLADWPSLPLSKCLPMGLCLLAAIPMILSMLIQGLSIYRKLRRREHKA